MKKFISVLLIVAMMATTFAMIFAGTVTAFAAEKEATIVEEEYQPIEEGSIGAKFAAAFVWLFNELKGRSRFAGVFSILMDGIVDYVDTHIADLDGIYYFFTHSGIVEWIAHKFPH